MTEERIHPGYYTTLEERRENVNVPNKVHLLHGDTEQVLDALFTSETIIISLPYWRNQNDRQPQYIYHIRFSRNNPGTAINYLFSGEYNPLVIYRNDRIVGTIYEQYYFSRSKKDAEWILHQFEEIEKDPVAYFSSLGERWGRCMICSRKLTTEKSLERAIGPVCYRRIEAVPRFDVPQSYDLNKQVEIDPKNNFLYLVDKENPYLNYIELNGMRELSRLMTFYLYAGFRTVHKPDGRKELVFTPKEKPIDRDSTGTGISIREERGQIHVFSWPFKHKEEIKTIPGTRWNPQEKSWIVPSTQRNRFLELRRSLNL